MNEKSYISLKKTTTSRKCELGEKKKKKMLDKNQMKREKQKRSMRGTLLWDLENPYSGLNLVAGSAAA